MKYFLFLLLLVSLPACTRLVAPDDAPSDVEKQDQVQTEAQVSLPVQNSSVSSPLAVEGSAPGTWFSEGVLSVRLELEDGTVVAQTSGTAQGDWMTIERVPFKATLEFTTPDAESGVLVIANDNPSGLPEHSKTLEVPVQF